MQEGKHSVEHLLRAIEQNIDDSNINTLAALLNYHTPQLKQDIEAISKVSIENKCDHEMRGSIGNTAEVRAALNEAIQMLKEQMQQEMDQ